MVTRRRSVTVPERTVNVALNLASFVKRALAGTLTVNAVEPAFRVGTMALAWDSDDEVVVIEAQAITEDEDDDEPPLIADEDEDGPPLLRVRLAGSAARAFVSRAQAVVAAGRPPCPFCGGPLDAGGHVCPRANGYRR